MEWTILILIGLVAGTFGSLVGLGGGIIIVPSLLFVNSLGILEQSISPQNAVGISLMVIVISAFSTTIANSKQKRVDFKSGLFFFAASGPASIIGSFINKYIEPDQFYLIFGLIMLLTTYLLAKQKTMKPINIKWDVTREYIDKDGKIHNYGYNIKLGYIITFFAGFLGGLLGIGGGTILVPMMIILFQFPIHVATATSVFIILLTSSLSSISHIYMGNVIFSYVLVIGIGAYTGGKIGSYISSKMSSNALILTLRLVIVLIAVQMIYNSLVS